MLAWLAVTSLSVISFVDLQSVCEPNGFGSWKLKFNKTYNSREVEELRKGLFNEVQEMISEHNKRFQKGEESFFISHNEFSDHTKEESKKFTGRDAQLGGCSRKRSRFKRGDDDPFPYHLVGTIPATSIDYRKTPGMLGRVRMQGDCGSCYSFGSVESLECQYFKKHGVNLKLSKQQILDCDTGNGGCDGGLDFKAFEYILNNGIASETDYPYKGEAGQCLYNSNQSIVNITNFKNLLSLSDEEVMQVLTVIGPVSIGIDSSDVRFSFYKGGIYSNPRCDPSSLDHSVLLVGYGENNQGSYWIIKNSWGESWGYSGYAYMARGSLNDCGIAQDINYPIL